MNNSNRSILPPIWSVVPRRLKPLGLASLALATLSLSCTQPGYRNEVYPGQQGQYVIKQVPVAPIPNAAPAAQPTSPTNTVPTNSAAPVASSTSTPQPADSDPDSNLTTVQSLWPKLSPANRAAVADLTRHLASP